MGKAWCSRHGVAHGSDDAILLPHLGVRFNSGLAELKVPKDDLEATAESAFLDPADL